MHVRPTEQASCPSVLSWAPFLRSSLSEPTNAVCELWWLWALCSLKIGPSCPFLSSEAHRPQALHHPLGRGPPIETR